MNFFEGINRWQFVVAAAVIVVGINLGVYYLSYLPNTVPESGPSQGQDLTVPVEDTAPKTVSKTPAQQSTPPPSETQYRP